VTSSLPQWGGARYKPISFTEQGVAMLSSVLRSKRAVHVNIEIMRAFVRLRQMLSANKELERKLAALEKKYEDQFKVVFEAIHQLMTPPETKKKKIGFDVKDGRAVYGKRKISESRIRITQITSDFSSLKRLGAFQRLEKDISKLKQNGWIFEIEG
jgi:hypothetical protein